MGAMNRPLRVCVLFIGGVMNHARTHFVSHSLFLPMCLGGFATDGGVYEFDWVEGWDVFAQAL